MKSDKKFWSKMSKNYDAQVFSRYNEAYNKTIENTKKYLKSNDTVLDYACGTGITTIELCKYVKKINAIDISQEMINIAREKSNKENIKNIEFDVLDIFDDKYKKHSFDVIMAFNILYFINDVDKVINRINELLKPQGLFISVTDCLGEKKTFITMMQTVLSKVGVIPHIRQFKISELKKIIRDGKFSIIESENLHDIPPNYYIVARKNNS